MKQKIYILICVTVMCISVGFVALVFYSNQNQISPQALWNGYRVEGVRLEEKTYSLIVAETPTQWEKGLMFVREKGENFDGMIFYFPENAERTFWNKNTLVDLDVYWMDGEQIVGKDFLPSIQKSGEIVTVSSGFPADTVVEIIR